MKPEDAVTLIHFDVPTQSYTAVQLRGVHIAGERGVAAPDKSVRSACRYTIRIPENVDAGGRIYRDSREFGALGEAERARSWTLCEGDAVVFSLQQDAPAALAKRRDCTVTGIADNRRGVSYLRHWKLTGL